jgi:hypothetical protein
MTVFMPFFQVEYSGKMEPFATKLLLGRMHKQRMDIRVFTTDRSTQLKTLMKELNEIRVARGLRPLKHSYDVWHLSKSVCKDLWAASKLKKCQTLGVWIKSIRNMLYFSFANCKGNALLLHEMIMSIPKHVSGVHSFPENTHFKHCLHGDLGAERDKPWLKEDSLSMKKLVSALRGKNDSRIKDIDMMTENQHTSRNESLNAEHNVHFSKSYAYDHPQAYVRACLTAIDHNKNANRPPLLDQDGKQRQTQRCSRDGQEYSSRGVLVPKDTSWRKELFSEVLEAVRCRKVPDVQIPTDDHLKLYSRKRPAPDKSIIVEASKKRRRFLDQHEQNS